MAFAPSLIQIVVQGDVTEESVKLNVSPNELVENIRKIVLQKLPNVYRLSNGRELIDGDTLSDYYIRDGAEIYAYEYIFKNVSKIHGIYSLGFNSFRRDPARSNVESASRLSRSSLDLLWNSLMARVCA
jgi:hypothetical protein